MILLTINVATLKSRSQKRVEQLKNVIPPWCELQIDFSENCLGDKRQKMLENAKGKYVTVVDDDDEITDHYFNEIFKGMLKNVDVVCVPVSRYVDGVFDKDNHSGRLNPLKTCDLVSHFCAIKKELALISGYRSIGFCEDLDFCLGLKDILKTAYYIKKPIYKQYFINRHKEYNKFKSFYDVEPRVVTGSLAMV